MKLNCFVSWIVCDCVVCMQVDLLPEIALAPRVLSNYVAALTHNSIRADLDKFLQTRHQPVQFLAELPAKLRLSSNEVGGRSPGKCLVAIYTL